MPASSQCAVEVKEGKVAEMLRLRMSTLELSMMGGGRACFPSCESECVICA